jgi:uncharacterized membrane protein YkoI
VCMRKEGMLILAIFFISLTAVLSQESGYPEITEQTCGAINRCPEGLECYGFPKLGLRCAEPNPCSWYNCPKNTQCTETLLYPSSIACACKGGECSISSSDETAVSYDLVTQTEIYTPKVEDEDTPSSSVEGPSPPIIETRSISIWKAESGNKGILETATDSVEYTGELSVEDKKLFMEIEDEKKQINVMPENAVAISKIAEEKVESIKLSEESKKPVYSIKSLEKRRILFLIPVNAEIETKIDAETGEILGVKSPWWVFLSSEG